ncbi:hypothetical protein C4D60_Mb01t15070 [Musa balbisiana]|uniref:Uncharacterized protein n=1 Tax=Musa balbisiana TaxID=52838 RepID=A0A4S8JMK6_MUSBA|nr:hypothetical protein C4D60_Mb01t15070 [Musa balbisiana]
MDGAGRPSFVGTGNSWTIITVHDSASPPEAPHGPQRSVNHKAGSNADNDKQIFFIYIKLTHGVGSKIRATRREVASSWSRSPFLSRLLLFGVPTSTKSALAVDHDKLNFDAAFYHSAPEGVLVLYEELMLALCFLPGAKSIEVDVFVPQVKLMADHWTSKKLPENYLGGVGFISIPMRKMLNSLELLPLRDSTSEKYRTVRNALTLASQLIL